MNRTPPSLRRHVSGQYFCRWGGEDHYFGHDAASANKQYLTSLTEWAVWRAKRDGELEVMSNRRTYTVVELAGLFMNQKELEGGDRGKDRRRYYRNHLRRFIGMWRDVRADKIRPADVNALKLDMIRAKHSPRNIQHDLTAVKSLFRWAAALEMVPPVNLDVVHAPEGEPVPDKSFTLAEVWASHLFLPEQLGYWVAVQYLTLSRPSEMVRIAANDGEWEEPWLFRCRSKVGWRTGEARRIVFSDSALSFLRLCEPRWSRYDTYYQAVYRAVAGTDFGFFSPHPLRHSGATHLAQAGVDRRDIDLLLGHLPSRVSRIYCRIDWEALRGHVARIAQCTVP
jgi:integrase